MVRTKFIKKFIKVWLLSSTAFIFLQIPSYSADSAFRPYAKGSSVNAFMVYGKDYLDRLHQQRRCLGVTATGKTPQQLSDAIVACLEKERNDAIARQAQQAQQQILLAQQAEQQEALRRAARESEQRRQEEERARIAAEQRRQEEERGRREVEQRRQEEERARIAAEQLAREETARRQAAEQEVQRERAERQELQNQLQQRAVTNLANLPRFSGGLLETLMQLTFQADQGHVRGGIKDFTTYISRVGAFVLEHVQLINNDIAIGNQLNEYLKFSRPQLPTLEAETKFREMRLQANSFIEEAFDSLRQMHNIIKDAITRMSAGTTEEQAIAQNLKDSRVWEALDILYKEMENIDLASPDSVEQVISALKAEGPLKSLGLLIGKNHLLQVDNDNGRSAQDASIFLRDKSIDFLNKNGRRYFDDYSNILRLYFLIQPTPIETDTVEHLNIVKYYIPNLKQIGRANPIIKELSEISDLINKSLKEEKKANYAKMINTLLNREELDTIEGINNFIATHNQKAKNISDNLNEIANNYIARKHLDDLRAWYSADGNINIIRRIVTRLPANWASISNTLENNIKDIRDKIDDYAKKSTTTDFNKRNALLSIQAAIELVIKDRRRSAAFVQEIDDFHVDINPYDNSFIESLQKILYAKNRYDNLQGMVAQLELLEQIAMPGAAPSREIFQELNNIIRIYNDSLGGGLYRNVLTLTSDQRATLYSHILPLLYVEFPNSPQNNFPAEWKNIGAPIVQHMKNTFTAYQELKEALATISPESLQSNRFDYLDLSQPLQVQTGTSAPSSAPPLPGPMLAPPLPTTGRGLTRPIPTEIKLKMDALNAFLRKIEKWAASVPADVAKSYYTNLFNQLIKPFYTNLFVEYPEVEKAKELLLSEIGKLTDSFIMGALPQRQMREFYQAKFEEALNSPDNTPEFISLVPRPSASPTQMTSTKDNEFFTQFMASKSQRNPSAPSSTSSGNATATDSRASSSSSSGNATATASRGLTIRQAQDRLQTIGSSNPMLTGVRGLFDGLGDAQQRAVVEALDEIPGTGEVSNEAFVVATLVADAINKPTPVSAGVLNELKEIDDPAKHIFVKWSLLDIIQKRNILNLSLPEVDSKFDNLLLEWTIKVQEGNKAALVDQWNALKVNSLIVNANSNELRKFYEALAVITLANREIKRRMGGTNPMPTRLDWETYGKDYLAVYFEGDDAINENIRPSGFVEAIRQYRDGR